MPEIETIQVETTTVGCDGNGSGDAGHPVVYLMLGKEGKAECPYCSRRFVLKPGARAGGPGH